jgi:hypothetical protein
LLTGQWQDSDRTEQSRAGQSREETEQRRTEQSREGTGQRRTEQSREGTEQRRTEQSREGQSRAEKGREEWMGINPVLPNVACPKDALVNEIRIDYACGTRYRQ